MKTKVYLSSTCPSCAKGPSNPFRVYANGKVLNGCVDHFHTGHLVAPSESAAWHGRPEAKKIRAASKAARGGYVTEYSRDVPAGTVTLVTDGSVSLA